MIKNHQNTAIDSQKKPIQISNLILSNQNIKQPSKPNKSKWNIHMPHKSDRGLFLRYHARLNNA